MPRRLAPLALLLALALGACDGFSADPDKLALGTGRFRASRTVYTGEATFYPADSRNLHLPTVEVIVSGDRRLLLRLLNHPTIKAGERLSAWTVLYQEGHGWGGDDLPLVVTARTDTTLSGRFEGNLHFTGFSMEDEIRVEGAFHARIRTR